MRQKSILIKACLISVGFIIISIVLGPIWESNDDPAMAYLLSRFGNDYSPFQWRIFSKVLNWLYLHVQVVDWWAVSTFFSIWLSAFACVYVVFRRYTGLSSWAVSFILLVLLWIVALHRLNFTRTAIVVSMAGCLLIADSVFVRKIKIGSWVEFALGCVMLLLGASIRSKCALIALGFLAVIGLVRLLLDNFTFRYNWFSSHAYQIFMLCSAVVVFFSAWGLNQLSLTPEQQEYEYYNELRSAIQDYSSRYPEYEETQEHYAEAGIGQNAYEMLQGWFSEDTEVYTTEVLENIVALGTETSSLDEFFDILNDQNIVTIFVLLFVCALCCRRGENWLRNGAVIIMFICSCLYLSLSGRIPTRVYLSLVFAAAVSATFLSGSDDAYIADNKNYIGRYCRYPKRTMLLNRILSVAVVIGYVFAIGLGLYEIVDMMLADNNDEIYIQLEQDAEKNRGILDLIDADHEHIYMFDIYYAPASMNSAFTFWETRPAEYCTNRFDLGGWDARHPYSVNLLAQNGISNPVRSLFERTDVYSTYSPRLLNYLKINYDLAMSASEIGDLKGIPIVKYSSVIDDKYILSDDQINIILDELYYCDWKDADSWYISLSIDPNGENNRVFFCNITVGEIRYTYQLRYDVNTVSAYMYGIDSELDLETADIVIYELQSDGEYVAYNLLNANR